MTEQQFSYYTLYTPELLFILCMIWKKRRDWFFEMIEDGDSNINHADGLFMLLLLGVLWTFRWGSDAIIKCIYEGKDLKEVAIICYSTACTLLGVRIGWNVVRGKISNDKGNGNTNPN